MRVIYLGSYAPNALRGIINGSDREAAGRKLFESVGGKLESVTFTRGEYDAVAIVEVPDQQTSTGVTTALRASGAFNKLVALEEVDLAPIRAIAKNALDVFEPAG